MSQQDERIMSRRQLVGGLDAGVATVAAATAVPALSQVTVGGPTVQPMLDPTTKYPKPPYSVQPQEWPGLASKMNRPRITARRLIKARAVFWVARR